MNKKMLFIIGVVLIALCAIAATLLIVIQMMNGNPRTTPPVSYPSYPGVNVVQPGQQIDLKNYTYALITPDDTIKIKTALGEELLINIDNKKWQNIQWSENGTYVSALGETDTGVFNLFIYNTSTKIWLQTTLFTKDGVTSYQWIDNDTVLFTADGWLHRYKYSSLNEVVKIYEFDGEIVELSPNDTTILLQDSSDKFLILSVDGKLLFTLDKITVGKDKTPLKIVKAHYNKDAESLLLVTLDNKFYMWTLGDTTATQIKDLPDTNITIVCSQEVDLFKAYTITGGNLISFFEFGEATNSYNSLSEKAFEKNVKKVEVECTQGNKLLSKLATAESSTWYQLEEDNLQKLVILDGAKEVAAK